MTMTATPLSTIRPTKVGKPHFVISLTSRQLHVRTASKQLAYAVWMLHIHFILMPYNKDTWVFLQNNGTPRYSKVDFPVQKLAVKNFASGLEFSIR